MQKRLLHKGSFAAASALIAVAIIASAVAQDDNKKSPPGQPAAKADGAGQANLKGKADAAKAAKAKAKADAKAGAPAAEPLPANNLSFIKHVAPIFIAKCSRCHITQARGQFSMATFEALKKGPPDGIVFRPGKSMGSRLIDLIESGDMPRAGAKVTKPELTAISKWIDEGAKFDGPDEKAPLARLVSSTTTVAPPPETPRLTVTQATGREAVHFSKDIAPVLVENCFSCHSGQQVQGNFQMARFTDMLRGGQSGNPWVPGVPEESLLIKKLKGTAGARMPQPRTAAPLADAVIAKFEKWISEGGRYDGTDPNQSTQFLAALVRAKSVNHDELSADRLTAAKRMWKLASPSDTPTTRQTKHLSIVSSLPEGLLNDVVEAAEQQAVAVAKQFRVPADQPLVKGRITLFVVPTRYDYREFGRMVEQRTIAKDSVGHWKYNQIDAYGVIVPPGESGEYSLAAVIGQQLASVYIASLAGNPPAWFSDGTGRAVASRADLKSARTRLWNERLRQLSAGGNLAAFLEQKLSPEDTEIAAYGFARDLMGSAGKYTQLSIALRNGELFDVAFPRIFGGAPQALAAAWAKKAL